MPSDPSRIADLPLQPFEALGAVVLRNRTAAGMTQEGLEAASTVHVTHIRGIEAGRRNPSLQVLWRLASGLGVPFATLCAEVEAEVAAASDRS